MIDLFTSGAPSPRKVSIMLEEVGLPYRAHWINVYAGEHRGAEFLALNPNGRLPAILDHDHAGEPLLLWESAAILIYLAEKTGQLLPPAGPARYEVLKWASFQATHAPYLGNAHWYRLFAPEPERYSIDRFVEEAERIYQVVERRLGEARFLGGEAYSIADISLFPWIEYHDWQGLSLDDYPNVARWFREVGLRPAVERGRSVPYPHTEFGDSPQSRLREAQILERLSGPARTPTRRQ